MAGLKNKELLQDWDYEKNEVEGVTPETVCVNTKVWWKCHICEHSWQTTARNRDYFKSSCPHCNKKGRKLQEGVNDLATKNPELLEEWNYEKNEGLCIRPNEVASGSSQIVWWKCKVCNYEWQNSVNNRTKVTSTHSRGTGCPCCSGRALVEGVNDLATTHPELLEIWDYEKNKELGLEPTNVTHGRNIKVWWKCKRCGTETFSSIVSKKRSMKCSHCQRADFLVTKHSELMVEWNYEKNEALGIFPNNVSVKTKVWWKCSKGHEWKALISNRTRKTGVRGCPYCKGKITPDKE